MTKVFIGTSGYQYHHWRNGVFYPKDLPSKDEFNYYSQIFNTVEINATFYGLPNPSVWKNWANRAPKDFAYALKMNRLMTHNLKLKNPENIWQTFYSKTKKLENHLGPILFQLPPNFSLNLERLKNLIHILPQKERFAFEFRDKSWFVPEVYKVLKQNNWALAIVSAKNFPSVIKITANFVYLRFHGPRELYRSSYSNKELKNCAKLINNWKKTLDVYAYFNNDINAFAPKNALTLKKMIEN